MLPVLSWWISSTYRYSCSTVHCVALGPAFASTVVHAVDAQLRRAQVRAMQFHPLRRDPALEPEHAELGVRAVVVDEPREQQRRQRLPAGVVALPQRLLERGLVRVDESLREVVDRLPDALGELGGGVVVLDVLLDELAAIGAQRGVEEFERLHAPEIDRLARLAHRVERAHHVLLAADDVERRQLAQPARDGLRGQQRVRDFLGAGCQKAEHCTSPGTAARNARRRTRVLGRKCARRHVPRRRNWHL